MTSTRCLVTVLLSAAFLAVLVSRSCCKSIEDIDTVHENSNLEKQSYNEAKQEIGRNRREADSVLTDDVSLASKDSALESKRLSKDEIEEVEKRGFRRRSRRSRRSRRTGRNSSRRRSSRARRRSKGRRNRRQRSGRKGSSRKFSRRRKNGGGFNPMEHIQTGLDAVNTGLAIADRIKGSKEEVPADNESDNMYESDSMY